jgi:hypothetical protein
MINQGFVVSLTLAVAFTSLPATVSAAPTFDAGTRNTLVVGQASPPATSQDFGVTLLDWISSAFDVLSTYQDAIASEAYLDTATQPSGDAQDRLGALIGCPPECWP